MKRIITLIFAFLFALMMLISCAASPNTEEFQQDNSSSSSVEEEPSSSPSDDTAVPESGKTGLGDLSGNVTSDSDRKLVYKADYNIETLDYDGDYQKSYLLQKNTTDTSPLRTVMEQNPQNTATAGGYLSSLYASPWIITLRLLKNFPLWVRSYKKIKTQRILQVLI